MALYRAEKGPRGKEQTRRRLCKRRGEFFLSGRLGTDKIKGSERGGMGKRERTKVQEKKRGGR